MNPPSEPTIPPPTSPWQQVATLFALLLASTIPMLPAALEGHMPRTHEGMRYEHLAALFLDALRHGEIYPRWLPGLAGGYGYPTFVFYQPIVFYAASAISACTGFGMIIAMQLVAFAFSAAGCFGAFMLARQLNVGRAAGVACAILFLITPYAFTNLYVRGDHSEYAAMMLTPWPIACLLIARRRINAGERAAIPLLGAACTLALLLPTHPALSMLYVPLVFALAVVGTGFIVRSRRARWLKSLACVGVLVTALSSPYWYPVWQNAPFVRLGGIAFDAYDPLEHTIEPWRLIYQRWGYGTSGYKKEHIVPSMSFQLGLPHLLMAVAGLLLGWRRPWVVATALVYAFLAWGMTVHADAFLWQFGSPIRIIQFPWRMLGPIAPLQVLLAAAAFARVTPKRPMLQGVITFVCVASAAFYYRAMFHTSPFVFQLTDKTESALPWWKAQRVLDAGVEVMALYPESFTGRGEFTPKWAPEVTSEARKGPLILANGDVSFAPTSTDYRIDATVVAPTAEQAILQQYYFPGWRVEVNGEVVPFEKLQYDTEGRIVFELPAGSSRVVAFFDGPENWRTRSFIAAFIGIVATVLIFRSDRKPPASSTDAAGKQQRGASDVGGGEELAHADSTEPGVA
jgi:hypothetical protein